MNFESLISQKSLFNKEKPLLRHICLLFTESKISYIQSNLVILPTRYFSKKIDKILNLILKFRYFAKFTLFQQKGSE